MKIIQIITLILTLFSCSDKDNEEFVLPMNKDINEIVEAIINHDSIPVYKNNASPDTIVGSDNQVILKFPINHKFSLDLEKIRVFFPNDTSMNFPPPPPPPSGMGLTLNELINFCNENSHMYFSKKDSAYLTFQNNTLKQFVFHCSFIKEINTTNWNKQSQKKEEYFGCSIPIFSKDNTSAYVELTHHCYFLCGSASGYLLIKKNGKWTIIRRKTLWIS